MVALASSHFTKKITKYFLQVSKKDENKQSMSHIRNHKWRLYSFSFSLLLLTPLCPFPSMINILKQLITFNKKKKSFNKKNFDLYFSEQAELRALDWS